MAWRHMLPKGEVYRSLCPVATREWGKPRHAPRDAFEGPIGARDPGSPRGTWNLEDEPDTEMGESLAQDVVRTTAGRP